MPWGDELSETVPEGSTTSGIFLNPGERAHVQVDRTSGSSADIMLVQVLGTLTAGNPVSGLDTSALVEFRVQSGMEPISFVVADIFGFAVAIENDTDSPVGNLSGIVNYRKDNVDLTSGLA